METERNYSISEAYILLIILREVIFLLLLCFFVGFFFQDIYLIQICSLKKSSFSSRKPFLEGKKEMFHQMNSSGSCSYYPTVCFTFLQRLPLLWQSKQKRNTCRCPAPTAMLARGLKKNQGYATRLCLQQLKCGHAIASASPVMGT